MTSKSDAIEALKEQVALGTRLLHHYGLGSYQGHVSARIPGTETMVIRGRPDVSLERVEAGDLMIVDFDGNVVESSARHPRVVASLPLHAEIYRARAEVSSVVHTHQKWCTVFGIAGRTVLPVLHPPTASIAADPWPIYDETQGALDDATKAKVVAQLMGPGVVACHLRNHGMVFVGTTVSKAVLGAADAEEQAELTWQAMLLGTPEVIPPTYLQDDVAKRFDPPVADVRDGVARGEWGNQEWLDEHRDASGTRGITL